MEFPSEIFEMCKIILMVTKDLLEIVRSIKSSQQSDCLPGMSGELLNLSQTLSSYQQSSIHPAMMMRMMMSMMIVLITIMMVVMMMIMMVFYLR